MTPEPAADRPPLVLVPGTLCNALLWQPQVRSLADLTTPRVADISAHDSIEALAAQVLAAAPPRFLLAGLSMGGIVAFEMLRQAPARVLGLALLNTTPAPADPDQVEIWRRESAMARNGAFDELIDLRWIPSLLAAGGSSAGSLRDTIRTMAYAVGPEGFIRQVAAQSGRRDSRPALASITCPTIVLGGRDDSLCPPVWHEEMAAAIPHAVLAILEDCGHLSTLEQPNVVSAHLRDWVERTRRHAAPAVTETLGRQRA